MAVLVADLREKFCRDQLAAENKSLEVHLAAQTERVVAYEEEIIRQVCTLLSNGCDDGVAQPCKAIC